MELACEIVTEYSDVKESVRVTVSKVNAPVEEVSSAISVAAREAVDMLKERRTLIL